MYMSGIIDEKEIEEIVENIFPIMERTDRIEILVYRASQLFPFYKQSSVFMDIHVPLYKG